MHESTAIYQGKGLLPHSDPPSRGYTYPGFSSPSIIIMITCLNSPPLSLQHTKQVSPFQSHNLHHSIPGSGRLGLGCLLTGQFPGASASLSPPEESASFGLFHMLQGRVWFSLGKQSVLKKSKFLALKTLYNLDPTYPGISPTPPPPHSLLRSPRSEADQSVLLPR